MTKASPETVERPVDEPAYSASYYASIRDGSLQSARVVLARALEFITPTSVVDVGCGIGTWLRALEERGVPRLLGVDGDYVDRSQLLIPQERFRPADLQLPLQLGERFDLAITMEVAEHLDEGAADTFVASLVALAPVVLFSAAIPQQGGQHHVNEQWPSYWAEKFARWGYEAFDCIRPAVWDRPDVMWWYKQNALLFVSRETLAADPSLAQRLERYSGRPASLVHPEKYFEMITAASRPKGFRWLLREIAAEARRRVTGRRGAA